MLSAGTMLAGEKTVLHCFAFTPIETASTAEWDAWHKATAALPGKVKGLKRVWTGKLANPLSVPQITDAEARKKAQAGDGEGTGAFRLLRRQYGACMEFESMDAYKAYGPDPAHKEWEAVYGKVRVPGTTTFQLIGQ
jgi:hypothetical protein